MNTLKYFYKDHVAKLLAGENLEIVHQTTTWPKFDTKNRVLYLPMWDNLNSDTYDVLIGHETSHALETPPEWHDALLNDPKKSDFLACVNIVEDARIERKILERYPGLRPAFRRGYRNFAEEIFKPYLGKNVNKNELADRINLHFKLEVSGEQDHNIEFNKQEQDLVDRIAAADTFYEVVELAKELMALTKFQQYAQQNGIDPNQEVELEVEITEGEGDGESMEFEGEGSGEGENAAASDKDAFGDKSKGSDGEGDEKQGDQEGEDGDNGSGEGDEEGGQGDKEGKGAGDGDEESDNDKSKTSRKGKKGGTGESNYRPTFKLKTGEQYGENFSKTDEAFTDARKDKITSNSPIITYATVGKTDWGKYVTSYKTYLNNRGPRQPSYVEWRNANKPIVDLLVNEFNRRKAARRHENKRVNKTGELDLKKLHSFTYSEDLFKSAVALPGSKKHALLMIIDLSSSMEEHMQGTVKQLLTLTSFCDAVKIPYRVVGFTSGNSGHYSKPTDNRYHYVAPGSDLRMYEFFNEKMSIHEKNFMIDKLWSTWVNTDRHRMSISMGGTPLVDSMFYTLDALPELLRNTGAQIGHVIYLTDGEGHSHSRLFENNAVSTLMKANMKMNNVNVIVNHLGRKFNFGSVMGSIEFFRDVLEQAHGATLTNFYIKGMRAETISAINDKNTQWSEEYYINGHAMNRTNARLSASGYTNLNDFVSAYQKNNLTTRGLKVILQNFVDKISKSVYIPKSQQQQQ